mgnify:CR=1 FL=1|tara:strand:- start:2355 stop:2645 length:291 start_codon:yes stop_codon:yes gene_type:complete
MWSELIPFIFQAIVVLGTAGLIGSFKSVRRLFQLPNQLEAFERTNEEDHATVRRSVKQIERSQNNLSADMLALQERQGNHAIELARHEVRINNLDR